MAGIELLINNPTLFLSPLRKVLRDFLRQVPLAHKMPQHSLPLSLSHSLPLSQSSVSSVVNLLPRSRKRFTTRFALLRQGYGGQARGSGGGRGRAGEGKRRECCAIFTKGEYPLSENRATPPVELEPSCFSLLINNPTLFLSSSRKVLRDFMRQVLMAHKMPQHSLPFSLSHSLPLSQSSVSSVVNLLPVSAASRRAFTLIEVLVASVILFAGLGAVLKAYSMAVIALDSAADVLVSTAWLRDKVAVMELQGKDGSALMSSGGEIRLEGRDYRWEVDARDQAITPDLKLQTAVISITRSPFGAPHLLQAEWALFQDPPTPPPK